MQDSKPKIVAVVAEAIRDRAVGRVMGGRKDRLKIASLFFFILNSDSHLAGYVHGYSLMFSLGLML
jgi:hypothetical protein